MVLQQPRHLIHFSKITKHQDRYTGSVHPSQKTHQQGKTLLMARIARLPTGTIRSFPWVRSPGPEKAARRRGDREWPPGRVDPPRTVGVLVLWGGRGQLW